jgi:hypothetical protein
MKASIILLAGVLLAHSQGANAQNGPEFAEPRALSMLHALTEGEGGDAIRKGLGFGSAAEVSDAKLGDPIEIRVVQLLPLQRYEAEGDANKLLGEPVRRMYPVVSSQKTRCAVTVWHGTNPPRISAFGYSALIGMLEDARKVDSARSGQAASSYFAVEVPDLFTSFLGHYDQHGDLLLTMLYEDRRLPDLKTHQSFEAKVIFARLREFARQVHAISPPRRPGGPSAAACLPPNTGAPYRMTEAPLFSRTE